MTTVYCARWIIPVTSPPIEDGAVAVTGSEISAVGSRAALDEEFIGADFRLLGNAAIIPGLVNAHSHLELTAMRGFLDKEEGDFAAWLSKLTFARLERMSQDDLKVSVASGACEAVRAGITCVADASDGAYQSMSALREIGLRGIVFQESFGPDPLLAGENFEKLKAKVSILREHETPLVAAGVSPHAPYTVSASQLELISEFAIHEKLPLMMHAAESAAENEFLRVGRGVFAEGLAHRHIEWRAPGVSTIQYLARHGILETRPLLAHCIHVDAADIETIKESDARIAHCPKSNAKLGHGRAPLAKFLERRIAVGLGSDSVASNNTCDILEEARFAILMARSGTDAATRNGMLGADAALFAATLGGARALGLEGKIGELKAGLQADLAVVSLSGVHQSPSYDPITTLIFASSGRDVILTVIAGKEVYRDGQVTTVDEDLLRTRMKEIAGRLSV